MRCRCSSAAGRLAPAVRQRGAALVVAMLVFALCAALVVAMRSEFDRYFQRSANLLLAEQAQSYLRGGEELAAMALVLDYDQDKEAQLERDDLQELWAQPPQPYALDEGGWLSGSLEDLQGRFNLNRVTGPTQQGQQGQAGQQAGAARFTAGQRQFIRLLQALEEPPISEFEAIAITESVSDWIDSNANLSPAGAEDDFYYGQTPAYRAANRPMASVSELRAVANITPEIYQALEPLVTVWPEQPAPLNIHTAPAAVLRSIGADDDLNPLSESEAESLVELRKETPFEDLNAFLAHPVFDSRRENMTQMKTLLGENSSWFLLRAEVEVADRNLRLYSVLQRQNRRISAVTRVAGSL